MRRGSSFDDPAVAACYVHRPQYPGRIFDKLLEVSPRCGSLLDLGCGTGKVARRLAPYFASVTGVDASRAMLRVAETLEPATANVRWVCGLAESAEWVGRPFDLVVAAASIRWMDQDALVPRLRAAVAPDHTFALVNGDGAFQPLWQDDWDRFLARWIFELKGEAYEPRDRYRSIAREVRNWLRIDGDIEVVSEPITQRVGDFVACQHSRDSFAPFRLGDRMREFDDDLSRLLSPYQDNGMLSYSVKTSLIWGSIATGPS